MPQQRRTPETWINAGLKAISKGGFAGLQAEPLARSIGATKGSFYWHFKDVPTFHSEVLKSWSTTFIDRFSKTQQDESPVARLRALSTFQLSQTDRAVIGWSTHDKLAAKHVASVMKHVRSDIADSLTALDATHPDFPDIIMANILQARKGSAQVETLVDLMLMLK